MSSNDSPRTPLLLTPEQIEHCFASAVSPGMFGQVRLVMPRLERRYTMALTDEAPSHKEQKQQEAELRRNLRRVIFVEGAKIGAIVGHFQNGRLLRLEIEDARSMTL